MKTKWDFVYSLLEMNTVNDIVTPYLDLLTKHT